ncbi:hypothetical protein SDC9_66704 [bioreactor metagenome]|uniref:Uncharacterized protein n=1 Tax=bioreactor metagenome TaxID=1076179 RepID=A0A644XVS6_9ZZZZ
MNAFLVKRSGDCVVNEKMRKAAGANRQPLSLFIFTIFF